MSNATDGLLLPLEALDSEISKDELAQSAQRAINAFVAACAGTNTDRSYRSALSYWAAWLKLRYRRALDDGCLPPEIAAQFILDHLARPDADNNCQHLLPAHLDAALVAAGFKGKQGPLAYNTVTHRLAVLTKWHELKGWENPCWHVSVRTLLRDARKTQVLQKASVRKKSALVLEPLQELLATCTDGIRGVRDRALLLLAWYGGWRRCSEVTSLRIEDLRQLDADTWVYTHGTMKAHNFSGLPEKPLLGPAAWALSDWLVVAPAYSGPLFRRLYRGGRVSTDGLSDTQVARIVKRRAALAGLDGDWAAHSLRSGFVVEAGRQGVPLGEIMAMCEHRSVVRLIGYLQPDSLLNSRATELLEGVSAESRAPNAPAEVSTSIVCLQPDSLLNSRATKLRQGGRDESKANSAPQGLGRRR